MQKVYLLLRNNQQTGPYSLEELSQLQLKNTDLIWIEGKSAGWYYPYELEDVKPIFDKTTAIRKQESAPVKQAVLPGTTPVQQANTKPAKPLTPPKKIYVSMPNAPLASNSPVVESKPAVTETRQVETKKVDEIEQRSEELRRRLQAYPVMKEQAKAQAMQEQQQEIKPKAVQTPLSSYELEEVPTYATQPKAVAVPKKKEEPVLKHRVVEEKITTDGYQDLYDTMPNLTGASHRKSPSPVLQYVAVLFMVVLLVGAGWWVYNTFSIKDQQNDSNQQVVNPVQQTTVPATTGQPLEGNTAAANQLGDTSSSSGAAKVGGPAVHPPIAIKEKSNPVNKATGLQPITTDNKNLNNSRVDNPAAMQTATPTGADNTNVPPVVVVKKDNQVADNTNGSQAEQQGEKKEGFFSKLFKKKTKEDAAPSQEPATNAEGERTTSKRDANTTTPATAVETNIADQVQISMNTPEDKWMMGVTGLRLTLSNNSNADLKRAAVDVIYYNEQNEVLERKTVYFTNIRSGKSKSAAAPDHKTADHAGYRVVSAIGIQK
jgi:hypothetical protein